jgi:outer membrane protein OmpA-like peptidoglycan-associated protein
MKITHRIRPSAVALLRLLPLLALANAGLTSARADEPPPAVLDSQSIIRSLKPASHSGAMTRGLVIAPKESAGNEAGAGSGKVTLDIRFANDSDRLTQAAQAQLAQLGSALNSPELAQARFRIAGHTSATGAAEHNQKLSEGRARAVRGYLVEHSRIAPERIEATGYGSSKPLPQYPPGALQQRRVEIITLPPG